MAEWMSGTVKSGDLDLHYHRTGGDKPPLVLAHGFSDNGLCWTRVAKALEPDFDVVMVDARNHGESGGAVAGKDDLVKDLAAVIESLALAQPALLGHSMGAATVAGLAAMFPHLASRIVLEDPPWMAEAPQGEDRRDGFRKWISAMADLSVEAIATQGQQMNPSWHEDEFRPWARSKKQLDERAMGGLSLGSWQSIAGQIACPTLLVYADTARGGIVSEAVAAEAAALNPRIATCHISDAGHNIRREQFDAFVAAVSAFLTAP